MYKLTKNELISCMARPLITSNPASNDIASLAIIGVTACYVAISMFTHGLLFITF